MLRDQLISSALFLPPYRVFFNHLKLYNLRNFFIIERNFMKLAQVVGKFVTLKKFAMKYPKDHKLYAKEGQNCLRPFALLSRTHARISRFFILFNNPVYSVLTVQHKRKSLDGALSLQQH
jgi:hypothetical protein